MTPFYFLPYTERDPALYTTRGQHNRSHQKCWEKHIVEATSSGKSERIHEYPHVKSGSNFPAFYFEDEARPLAPRALATKTFKAYLLLICTINYDQERKQYAILRIPL